MCIRTYTHFRSHTTAQFTCACCRFRVALYPQRALHCCHCTRTHRTLVFIWSANRIPRWGVGNASLSSICLNCTQMRYVYRERCDLTTPNFLRWLAALLAAHLTTISLSLCFSHLYHVSDNMIEPKQPTTVLVKLIKTNVLSVGATVGSRCCCHASPMCLCIVKAHRYQWIAKSPEYIRCDPECIFIYYWESCGRWRLLRAPVDPAENILFINFTFK